MLLEKPTPTLRESRAVVLETDRLVLRQPTLADVKAIARVVGDKRVSVNLRRVPHPYTADDAISFVTTIAATIDTVFLVEHERAAIGLVGVSWENENAPELGYCFGVDHWGKGYATESARAVIDYAFEEFAIDELLSGARVLNPASRHVLEKCGFQWTGVELHRFLTLGSSTPVDRFKLERGVWASLKSWSSSTRR
ncbi:RimJ/RimL family protein N-acetyltransferase [Afipia massiliensis]|uniref:RimJ/RimL family protein N-acetyltransferase n=1 Tax=Afipia massiliensis TaxID=211460 RepID=A0A840MZT0_9BRAD|nr:GNAT family N-acetyltransferase [Afipia massiliensis]MBB5053343.1 RimJ/RimL family protein N-acetyltransferase [Afipia massiliensis]